MKKQTIIIFLTILVLIGLGWFVVGKNGREGITPMATTTLPTITKVDEHLTIDETLRDVNFCGKTYKVKQVMIDGVDVVQRIAEIVANGLISESFKGYYGGKGTIVLLEKGKMEKQICWNVRLSDSPPGEIIESTVKKSFSDENIGAFGEEIYPVSVEVSPVTAQAFYIALPSGRIYKDDGFSGTLIGPIGTLK